VRQGIHWQNIALANGREFTANDIVLHFDRLFGLGGGYKIPAPYWGTVAWTKSLTSITANDKYTVTMQWNTPNPEFVTENLEAPGASTSIENPEAVQQWGDVTDWHHAIGTGPFILTDFVSGSSMTLVKNPNYWGYDERYPQNQLPYVDKINYLVIPDPATCLAAMRTGKIDALDSISLANAQTIKKTNPEIVQLPVPYGTGFTLDPRNDLKPFSDIRVRQALQQAIDLPTIASTYYAGTCSPNPLSLTSAYLTGWGYPYTQWPQDLKDQYAYNPTAAKQLLAAAGFPNGFNTDIVAQNVVDLDLLQIIKSYFAAIGVNMDIRPLDSASFSAFVNVGHKNDGLAERSTGALGLAFYPIRDLNRLQTGQPSDVAMVSDPVFDAFYNQALAATTVDQVKQVLLAANKYVAQQHFVISLLQPVQFDLCQPWLKGYNAQYGATAGSSGPFFCWFYEARFWVDQSLKTSMGH
jgi:peptide/nickel transport system substrate-binding protein